MVGIKSMETGVIFKQAADDASKSINAEGMLRIWLVDDDVGYSEQLRWLLNAEPRVDCPLSFASATALLPALRQESPPDAILLDVQMPVLNGIEAIRPIKHLAPSTKVLMLTTFFDHVLEKQARAAGAADFLLKRYPPARVIAAIRAPSTQFDPVYHAHALAPR
jgi:DNA-binding NarL/FixJ family response regulator